MKNTKKYIIILSLCALFTPSLYLMEKAYIELEETANTWDCDIPTAWKNIRQVICDHIEKKFSDPWYQLKGPSLEKSLKIIQVPELLFPDLVPLFNKSFFSNLINQNERFESACNVIVKHYNTIIKQSLNGLTIDSLYTDEILTNLSQSTKKYLISLINGLFCQQNKYRLQTNHKANINNIVFNYKTKRIATASDDKTAEIWNLKKGPHEHTLQHDDAVLTVSFSHDGSCLVTATKSSCIIRIWDTITGQIKNIVSQNIFNRAYYDIKETFTLITLNSEQRITQHATWLCVPDHNPILVTQVDLPLLKINDNISPITHYPYTIKKEFLTYNIFCTKKDYKPSLLTIAFNNSKNNKEQLEGLLASKAFTCLYDIDKIPLKNSIEKHLLLLSKETNQSKS